MSTLFTKLFQAGPQAASAQLAQGTATASDMWQTGGAAMAIAHAYALETETTVDSSSIDGFGELSAAIASQETPHVVTTKLDQLLNGLTRLQESDATAYLKATSHAAINLLTLQVSESPIDSATNAERFLSGVRTLTGLTEKYGAHAPYNPLVPSISRGSNEYGYVVAKETSAPSDPNELISSHAVSKDTARALVDGKLAIMSIGRSGFVQESEARMFRKLLDDFIDSANHHLRRAGVSLGDEIAYLTSLTEGVVDQAIRRASYMHKIPCLTFISDDLRQYCAADTPYAAAVHDVGSSDYSDVSIGFSDVVLALPGGAWSLYNDIPKALAQGKEIVLVDDSTIPVENRSVFDGSLMMGNHGAAMLADREKITSQVKAHLLAYLKQELTGPEHHRLSTLSRSMLTNDQIAEHMGITSERIWDPDFRYAAEVTNFIVNGMDQSYTADICGKLADQGIDMTPQQVWQNITVVSNGRDWAGYIYKRIRGKDADLMADINSRILNAVTDASKSLNGAIGRIAITGRSQMINKASGETEIQLTYQFLSQLEMLLTESHGYSRRDIALVHGMSDTGVDGAALRTFATKGHPAIGIVKEEWAEWTNEAAKHRSDFIMSEHDTIDSWSGGFFGEGLGFKTDVLLVFEGNANVKGLVRKALEHDATVIVIPVTDDPMYADFFDVQKGKLFKDRFRNAGKWVMSGERSKALPQLLTRIHELTGINTSNIVLDNDNLTALRSDLDTLPEDDDIQHAISLVDEMIDMLDPSTTAEGNPNIHVVRNPVKAARIISGIIEANRSRKMSQ